MQILIGSERANRRQKRRQTLTGFERKIPEPGILTGLERTDRGLDFRGLDMYRGTSAITWGWNLGFVIESLRDTFFGPSSVALRLTGAPLMTAMTL